MVSLGSAIFAFMAAGTFETIEQAQDRICPSHRMFMPQESERRTYEKLYPLYSKLYFALGQRENALGEILPTLIAVAESTRAH